MKAFVWSHQVQFHGQFYAFQFHESVVQCHAVSCVATCMFILCPHCTHYLEPLGSGVQGARVLKESAASWPQLQYRM